MRNQQVEFCGHRRQPDVPVAVKVEESTIFLFIQVVAENDFDRLDAGGTVNPPLIRRVTLNKSDAYRARSDLRIAIELGAAKPSIRNPDWRGTLSPYFPPKETHS